jgi:hypothetical protein
VLQHTEPPHIYKDPLPHSMLMARHGIQAATTSQLKIHDTRHNRHWLMQCKRIWCRVCSAKNKETRMKFEGRECNITFFAIPCFKVYHSKLHFGRSTDTSIVKWNTQMSVILPLNYWTDIFQWRRLDEVMGVNGVWILQKGLHERTETCQRSICVWYMLHFANKRGGERKINAWRRV